MAIGETVLGAVLQVVFDRLASREVINFFRHSKFDHSLVDKLKTLMLAVQKLMLDAEYKQFTDPVVKQWLHDLKHWFLRSEEIVDEIAAEALRSSIESPPESQSFVLAKVRNWIPGSSSNSFEDRVSTEMKKVMGMLESMLSQKDALGLRELSVAAARAPLTQRVPTTCLMEDSRVFGRDNERENLLNIMLSDESKRNGVGVIAIVGLGGLGKTTLAKLVYNDSRVKDFFHLRTWVCVSTDEFDLYSVTKSILESILDQPYSGSPDLNFLQMKLSSELKEKRFLVVLDDVWNEDYERWQCLHAPFNVGANGSKIIVTTRNDEVASIMRTSPVFRPKPLSKEDGWSLFSRHAFDDSNLISNSDLYSIGRKIVHKCKGLPLALKTLGRLLRFKQEIYEWEEILNSRLWELPCEKSPIIPALRLSYFHLPSHLKRCFSYCCLFPKYISINRKQLGLLWMAENFVVSSNNPRRSTESIADEYVDHLLSRSLLEPDGVASVRMHDLVHDLAEEVFRDLVIRHEPDYPSKFSDKARHFSYHSEKYDSITKFKAVHEAKYLRTFINFFLKATEHYLSSRVSLVMVPQLYCLRVLSLSVYDNLLLPESIGNLKQLRYFDISKAKIKMLPESVSTLYNLQTLILAGCSCLEYLPEDLWRLSLLRHLALTGTISLQQMPKQMGKLKNLQTLTDFVIGKGTGSTIEELNQLPHIHDKLTLRRLQNLSTPEDALNANLWNKEILLELAFEFDTEGNGDSERARVTLENLKPHAYIKSLTINNYAGTRWPSWLSAGAQVYLKNLTFLCLSGCLYCHSLPPLGQLPSLEELQIEGMDYIVSLGVEFYGHNDTLKSSFPALRCLSFKRMKNWKVWSNIDAARNAVWFPNLQKLSLCDCPNLMGNLPIHIPFLEKLVINECNQLICLLPRVSSIHPLEVAPCPRTELSNALDLTSITQLRLEGLVQLVMLPLEIAMLSSLKDLKILDCMNLISLANVRLPAELNRLGIEKCGVLEFLPHGLVSLTHLHSLTLEKCPCLRWVCGNSLPTSLRSLSVSRCERLEFPIPYQMMCNYTSLWFLTLEDTGRNSVSFPLGKFPNLKYLRLVCCNDLENVYIPEDIGSHSLEAFRYLDIMNCRKLKMIGKETEGGEATVLPVPNLSSLRIWWCDNVKPVLIQTEENVLFPRLERLEIDNWNKITSWWNPSKSLLRFSHLSYIYINDQNAECLPECSLPGSVKTLIMYNYRKLRYLDGKALQSLTSLQELIIGGCPELEKLPEEELPPSLGCLSIWECPLIDEKYPLENEQYWSKFSHIPCVEVNRRCITGP